MANNTKYVSECKPYNGWSRSYIDDNGRLIYEPIGDKTIKLSTADLDMIDYHGLSLPPIDKKSEKDIDMGKTTDTHDKKRTQGKEQKTDGEGHNP